MTTPLATVANNLRTHAQRNLDDLFELLRVPSVSAISRRQPDMEKAALVVARLLTRAGCTAEIHQTAGHPIVTGGWTNAPGLPTVLVYGHYDVQPPDPLADWVTPPFEPAIREGKVFARGATDDKGQMLTHIKSVEAWLEATGKLPLNVKFLIEGEEEVGSKNLDDFITAHRDELACDVVVVSDSSQYAPGIPAITYNLRGLVACEVTLHGPSQDLHSGLFGGSLANPVNALCDLLSRLHDEHGRVRIPGFYDAVVPLTEEERHQIRQLPFDDAGDLKRLGVSHGWGEAGYSTLERRWLRPTCDVNGITGGYQGEGPKTIIPAKASAKITCRLVANQDASAIMRSLESYLREHLRPGLRMDFKTYDGCPAVRCDTDSPYMAAARSAIEQAFSAAPVLVGGGGSIPVVGTFKELLGVDTLLLGWGQDTDNLHSPNEHFAVEDFHRGCLASAYLWHEIAENAAPRKC